MRHPLPTVAGLVLAAAFSGVSFLGSVSAQAPAAALTGQVSSTEEAAMEGVLVSAKKAGSTITVTVVSDADGRFSFPAGKLAPGQYTLRIRAVGYELDGAESGRGAGAENRHPRSQARQDQGSRRAAFERRMAGQHSRHRPAEGPVCSTASAATRSSASCARTYDADEFHHRVLPRMQGYVQPEHADPSAIAPRRTPDGRARRSSASQVYRAAAEYLSTINLSTTEKWDYPLKTFPRPKGRATRVIYTEYDLPRAEDRAA